MPITLFDVYAGFGGTAPGDTATVSAGDLEAEMARLEEYVRMAREHPNVYLDTCLSTSPRGLLARLVAEVGAEKVVWGSDAYFYSETHQIGKVIGADLPEAV